MTINPLDGPKGVGPGKGPSPIGDMGGPSDLGSASGAGSSSSPRVSQAAIEAGPRIDGVPITDRLVHAPVQSTEPAIERLERYYKFKPREQIYKVESSWLFTVRKWFYKTNRLSAHQDPGFASKTVRSNLKRANRIASGVEIFVSPFRQFIGGFWTNPVSTGLGMKYAFLSNEQVDASIAAQEDAIEIATQYSREDDEDIQRIANFVKKRKSPQLEVLNKLMNWLRVGAFGTGSAIGTLTSLGIATAVASSLIYVGIGFLAAFVVTSLVYSAYKLNLYQERKAQQRICEKALIALDAETPEGDSLIKALKLFQKETGKNGVEPQYQNEFRKFLLSRVMSMKKGYASYMILMKLKEDHASHSSVPQSEDPGTLLRKSIELEMNEINKNSRIVLLLQNFGVPNKKIAEWVKLDLEGDRDHYIEKYGEEEGLEKFQAAFKQYTKAKTELMKYLAIR